MIAKLFGRKHVENKPKDPVAIYVNKMCEAAKNHQAMGEKI